MESTIDIAILMIFAGLLLFLYTNNRMEKIIKIIDNYLDSFNKEEAQTKVQELEKRVDELEKEIKELKS